MKTIKFPKPGTKENPVRIFDVGNAPERLPVPTCIQYFDVEKDMFCLEMYVRITKEAKRKMSGCIGDITIEDCTVDNRELIRG